MAESIRFDFLSTGADKLARDFKATGDNAAAAARGAKVLADVIDKLGTKEDRTAAESRLLASALKQTGDAEDRMAAKAVAADAAIRRLDDAMKANERAALEDAAANRALGDSFDKLAEKAGGPSLKGALAALSPALIPLTGGLAAGVAAVGVSFGAAAVGAGLFGAAAKSVLSKASDNLKKLQALELKVNTARTAAAKKAAEQQVAALKATWDKGYLGLLDALDNFQGKWQTVSQHIAVPALTAGIHALSDAIGFLAPAVTPVAAVFTSWGQAIDRYFTSRAGSDEMNRLAAAFGRFSADQLSALGVFFTDIGKGVANLIKLLGVNSGTLGQFSVYLDQWGGAFLRWSQSTAARHDVNQFLAYIAANGPVVKDLLKNLGTTLAVFSPGLSSVGALELRLVSDFLGLLARTPKAVAKPLIDVAGALLLLQKTGLISVGIKITGAAAKWLSGGVIDIGGGAAAGAEIRAAFASGGAAAAAEIRAAMVGGAAEAGTAGAGTAAASGGGLLSGIIAKVRPAAFAAAGAAIAGGIVIKAREDIKGGLQGIIRDIPHWFNFGSLGFIAQSAQGWADLIVSKIRHSLLSWEDDVRHKIAGSFDQTRHDTASIWNNITGFLSGSWHKLVGDSGTTGNKVRQNFNQMSDTILGAMRRAGQASDSFRTRNLAPILGEAGRVSGGIQGLQGVIDRLHGKTFNVTVDANGYVNVNGYKISAGAYFSPHAAGGFISGGTPGRDSVPGMLMPGEVVVPTRMVKAGAVDHLRGKLPGFAAGGVVGTHGNLGLAWPQGATDNIESDAIWATDKIASAATKAFSAYVKKQISATTSSIVHYKPGAGVQQWRGVTQQALRLAGANVAQLTDPVLYQMQTESGGNPTIVNKWDSNWFAGHPSVGLMQVIRGTFQTYAGRFRNTGPFEYGVSVNPLANIYSAIKYAQANYGPGLRNAQGGIGSGHGYDQGGVLPPGLSLSYNGLGRPEALVPARGGAPVIQLEVTGSGSGTFDAFLLQWIRENVRIKGGGNVQKAFGRR